jgi:hypothetical protein
VFDFMSDEGIIKKVIKYSKKRILYSSTTNAHSETGQMAVCCQHLTLGALSSRSAFFMLVDALFKKFSLFLKTLRVF